MILVDTSIWIDHLHKNDTDLVRLLSSNGVATHSMVIGELALGTLRDRALVLEILDNLPRATDATHDEAMLLVNKEALYGRGLSLVDVHILAASLLTPGTSLWTRDKRLKSAAQSLGVSAD
jgi:predicted nucleic acid-binding protein